MKKESRFEIIHTEGSEFTALNMIIKDKETGVNYLFVKAGYGAGLTPLLDASGKTVISEKE